MRKLIILLLLVIIVAESAHAQAGMPTPPYTGQTISNKCGLATDCGSVLVNSDTYMINSQGTIAARATGSSINLQTGFQVNDPLPGVLTPATSYPTPASVAGSISSRYNIVAAGGPTAMFVGFPQATTLPANVKQFGVFNQSSNPVALVPYPGDTFNVSAAATPFSCTTLKYCECLKLTATNWGCTIQ